MSRKLRPEPRHRFGAFWPRHSTKSRLRYQLAAKKLGAWTMSFFLSGLAALLVTQPASYSVGEPACVPITSQRDISGTNSVSREITLQFNYTSATERCAWTVPSTIDKIAIAVVGGGGGGGHSYLQTYDESLSGYYVGGGGGAGEVLYNPSLSVTPNTSHLIEVGSGGAGASDSNAISNSSSTVSAQTGRDTKFGNSITAKGGGAGGYFYAPLNVAIQGQSGGSGGGSIGNIMSGGTVVSLSLIHI